MRILAVVLTLLMFAPAVGAERFTPSEWYARASNQFKENIDNGKDAYSILSELMVNTTSIESIKSTRNDKNVAKILRLVLRLANTSDAETRKVGSVIIINLVDNTTICLVLRVVEDESVNSDFRFNLLQTIKVDGSKYLAELAVF